MNEKKTKKNDFVYKKKHQHKKNYEEICLVKQSKHQIGVQFWGLVSIEYYKSTEWSGKTAWFSI